MGDLIDRQAAIDAFNRIKNTLKNPETAHYDTLMFYEIEYVLEDVEPADVVQVRHGHWSLVGWHKGMKVVECSCCKKRAIGATDFCPNCGAKMDCERKEEKHADADA